MRKIVLALFVLSLVLVAIPAFTPEPVSAMTGSGTVESPYMIYDVDDLQVVANGTYEADAHYELANDIDASATATWNWHAGRGVYVGFIPISSSFTGNFDGNNYAITGLYTNSTAGCGGIFRMITTGTVSNVHILDASITVIASGDDIALYSGVLAGRLTSGTVEYVGTSGTLYGDCNDTTGGGSAYNSNGGLIGHVTGGTIDECYAYVDVEGHGRGYARNDAGGLIGYTNGGTASDCYAMGSVHGDSHSCVQTGPYVGGLVGNGAYGTRYRCYSTGAVSRQGGFGGKSGGLVAFQQNSTTYNSFWDKDTSGQVTSDGGTGKTTAEMKTESTFTGVGWDFTTVWDMEGSINGGYPYLLWWYNPYEYPGDFAQVVWFQPNAIIEGTTLPNRTGEVDGIITWGANPAGITITHGGLIPEEEYDFEPIIPDNPDIIKPEPEAMTGDIDLDALEGHPLYPMVQILSIDGFLNERLAWIGLAWLSVILAMFLVHIGPDTHRNSKKPHHFILTVATGLGLSILWWSATVFPYWVIIIMAVGLIPAIIWERQPVI